jgi:hypothetical protein
MLTKRLAFFLGIGLLSIGVAACGDDKGMGDDGGGADACVGHLCPGPGPNVTDNEGGNILFEYIYLDNDLRAFLGMPGPPLPPTVQRVMAYFMSAMTPEKNPLPTPGQCVNLVTTKGWPAYVPPAGMHTDLDVGTLSFAGKNPAGADSTIDVPKQPAGKDMINRAHDTWYQDVIPDAATKLKPDSLYSVKFGGAGNVPATEYKDAIYLGDMSAVSNPALEDDGPLKSGTDFPVSWTAGSSANKPAGDEVLGITWLLTVPHAQAVMLCPVLLGAQGFTIPGAVIADFKATAVALGESNKDVILLRNAVDHKLQWLPLNDPAKPDNKRRVDCLSVLCWAQRMDLQ